MAAALASPILLLCVHLSPILWPRFYVVTLPDSPLCSQKSESPQNLIIAQIFFFLHDMCTDALYYHNPIEGEFNE